MARSDLKQVGQQKVVFRRIKGRIVPIRVSAKPPGQRPKKSTSALKKSPFLISAGLGIALSAEGLAGFTVGKLSKQLSFKAATARNFANAATLQRSIGKDPSALLREASKIAFGRIPLSQQFARVSRLGSAIRVGGQLIGAGFVGAGINKIIEDRAKHDSGITGDIISQATGLGIAVLGTKLLRIGLKGGLKGGLFKLGKKKTQLEFDL